MFLPEAFVANLTSARFAHVKSASLLTLMRSKLQLSKLGFAVLAILIVFSLVAQNAAAQAERPLVVRERYDTMPFSAGSIVIPMDDKQNDTIISFGLIFSG